MKVGLILLLLVLAGLLVSNPGMNDFRNFAGEHSEQFFQAETGGGDVGRALSRLGASFVEALIDRFTVRENYYAFSTYTIDLNGPEKAGEEWRFLGIGGQFVELE